MKKPHSKFIIFGQGRSGSTLLKQLLNSHPEINCEGELLNLDDGYINNSLILKLVHRLPFLFFNYRKWISKSSIYGFTLLFYQYYPQKYILNKLVEQGWKVILLTRQDSFSQSLSHLVAKQTSVWHRYSDDDEKPAKVTIDPKEFKQWISALKKNKAIISALFKNLDHIEVVYENDLKQKSLWPESINRVFDYLGTYNTPFKANLKKTYSRPYSEIVENYDSLKEIFEHQ